MEHNQLEVLLRNELHHTSGFVEGYILLYNRKFKIKNFC